MWLTSHHPSQRWQTTEAIIRSAGNPNCEQTGTQQSGTLAPLFHNVPLAKWEKATESRLRPIWQSQYWIQVHSPESLASSLLPHINDNCSSLRLWEGLLGTLGSLKNTGMAQMEKPNIKICELFATPKRRHAWSKCIGSKPWFSTQPLQSTGINSNHG